MRQARSLSIDLVEVQLPREGAGLRGRRELGQRAKESVDHGRLARVRPPNEENFWPIPGKVLWRLGVPPGFLEASELLRTSPAEEVQGHVVPRNPELVHDLASSQGLRNEPGAAIPADQLVKGLRQHAIASVWSQGQDVVLDGKQGFDFLRHSGAVSCKQLWHLLRSGLEVQSRGLDGGLENSRPGGDVLRPPTLLLQPGQMIGRLHSSCLRAGVGHVAQRLVPTRRLPVRSGRQLRGFCGLVQPRQCHGSPATAIALRMLDAKADDAHGVLHAQERLHQRSHSPLPLPLEVLPLVLHLLRLGGELRLPLPEIQDLWPRLRFLRLRVRQHLFDSFFDGHLLLLALRSNSELRTSLLQSFWPCWRSPQGPQGPQGRAEGEG
mmetsp:Transcript_39721/g.91840  ORF Transcript_39721/g.91840 Transcript_39721/m.91840 type:complete len:380 (+) Transcript_39721:842-1981(+)